MSGHGALLAEAVHTNQLVGLDFVFEMLPLARSKGYAVYQGDAAALPFADGQFDVVVCAEVMQYFVDPRILLDELTRVCKPGGTVIVSTLYKYSFLRFLVRTLSRRLHPASYPFPILRRTPVELVDALHGGTAYADEVAWVLSPTNIVLFDKPRALAMPFATNFILCMRKPASSS